MQVSEYLQKHSQPVDHAPKKAALNDDSPAPGVQLSNAARWDLVRMSSADRAKLLGSVDNESQTSVAAALISHTPTANKLPRIEEFAMRVNLQWSQTGEVREMPTPDVDGEDGGEDIAEALFGSRWVGRDAIGLMSDGNRAALSFDPSGSEAMHAWILPGVIIEASGEVFRATRNKLPFGPDLVKKKTGMFDPKPDGPALARAALSLLDAAIAAGTRDAAETFHGPSAKSLAGMILVRERVAAWIQAHS